MITQGSVLQGWMVFTAHTAIMEARSVLSPNPETHLFPNLKSVKSHLTDFCLCTYDDHARILRRYKVEKRFKLLHKQDNVKTIT